MRALLLLTALTMSAQTRQLAITIDDLPRGGTPSRYLRHPSLHPGPNKETKQGLSQFLKEQRLVPAPVPFDTSD